MSSSTAFCLKLLHILDIKPLGECVQNFLKQYFMRITNLLPAQRTYHEERRRRTGVTLNSPNVSPTFNISQSKLPIYGSYTCVSIFRIAKLDASHGDDRMNCRQSVGRKARVNTRKIMHLMTSRPWITPIRNRQPIEAARPMPSFKWG